MTARIPAVTVYVGTGCHLCEAALDVIAGVGEEQPLRLETVEIERDPGLERRYRERIPVVEIDGVEVFTFFVHPEALRMRLRDASRHAG